MASKPVNSKSQQPFIKLPVSIRDRLRELTGAELKTWLSYFTHADRGGVAWPNRDTLSRETGLYDDHISKARSGLLRKGWLKRLGGMRLKNGTLTGAVRFKATIPEFADAVETPAPDKHRHRRKTGTGEKPPTDAGVLPLTDAAKTPAQSSSNEVETGEVEKPEREGAGAPLFSLTDDELFEEACTIWEQVANQEAFGQVPTHSLPTTLDTLRSASERVTDFFERFAEGAALLNYCVFGLTSDTDGWRPSFAWLIEEKNLSKVLAGKYQADLRSLTNQDRQRIRDALSFLDEKWCPSGSDEPF